MHTDAPRTGLTRRLALAAPALLLGRRGTAATAGPERHQARAAGAFVDSVGINVHMGYGIMLAHTADIVAPALRDLGVRHLRDAAVLAPAGMAALRRLLQDVSLQGTLICEPTQGELGRMIDAITRYYGPALVAAVEGVNEPEGWFARQPVAGPDPLRIAAAFQQNLFRRIRSDAALDAVPVYGPSLIHAESVPAMRTAVTALDATNLHPYPGGRQPETRGWGPVLNGAAYGSLDYALINLGQALRADVPSVVTETGYWNTMSHNGVSEAAAACYWPRLLLHNWARGVRRTFIYELMDAGTEPDNVEHHYGLLRHDGSRKPAFAAVAWLLALLADTGPRASHAGPGMLAFTVEGGGPSLRTSLLQKRDGTFYLALWLAEPVWDPDRYVALQVDRRNARLVLHQPIAAIGYTAFGREWAPAGNDGVVTLEVSEYVTMVWIAPA